MSLMGHPSNDMAAGHLSHSARFKWLLAADIAVFCCYDKRPKLNEILTVQRHATVARKMLDILVTILLVTLFVLGLFGLVQWVLGRLQRFFPGLNSQRMNPPVGKWWLLLLGIVFWLDNLRELLNSGGLSEWTKAEYMNVFYLCAASFLIVYIWNSSTRSTQESTPPDTSEGGAEGRP